MNRINAEDSLKMIPKVSFFDRDLRYVLLLFYYNIIINFLNDSSCRTLSQSWENWHVGRKTRQSQEPTPASNQTFLLGMVRMRTSYILKS